MRRISTGVQGRSILGNFVATTNIFTTRESNQNLVLDPDGSGQILAEGDLKINGQTGSLILESSNGNDIKIETTTTSSSYTLTMPENPPANGEVLIVDGSGNLIFSDINLPVTNQSADTDIYYPLTTTSTSGDITGVSVSSSKLSFQPSSGTLTVTNFVESSSIVLKENFSEIENAFENILKLQPKIYDRKDGSSKNEPGLIAEEVFKILPNVVSLDKNKNPEGIKYTKLTVYLIECIKELHNEIKDLKRSNK